MNTTRHEIDDTERARPHVRLCHRVLSEALASGFSAVELTTPPGGTPTAHAESGGSWAEFMAFPPAVSELLIEYFKHMAGVPPEQHDADGTILVRAAGRDATIELRTRRNLQGIDELVLRFPARSGGDGAT
jgi:hypothetical protein